MNEQADAVLANARLTDENEELRAEIERLRDEVETWVAQGQRESEWVRLFRLVGALAGLTMRDIVERLRFDAARCEINFSKGVAGNIEEGIAEIERLRDENAALRAEIERLRRDCAELYQVIGVLANEAGLFEDREVTKALDNANAAANGLPRPHDDLLPFTPRTLGDDAPLTPPL